MKKFFQNKIVRTLALCSIVGFNLISLCMLTFAWFISKTKEQTRASEISISAICDVEIVGNNVEIYGFDIENDVPILCDTYVLNPYDSFIPTRNAHNRKFLKMKISYPNYIPADNFLKITITCASDKYTGNDGFVLRDISNLVQFKYYDNKNQTIRTEKVMDADGETVLFEPTPTTIYNDCVEVFDEIDELDTFVSNATTSTKSAVIVNDSAIPLTQNMDKSYSTELFIEYNYNDALAEYFKDNCGTDFDISVFSGQNSIKFNPDILTIEFALKNKVK